MAAAGGVTVSVKGNKVCTYNSITFSVIAPTSTYYNVDNGVQHDQGYADIGKNAKVYFAPDSVSFANLSMQELSGPVSSNGTWYCNTYHNASAALRVVNYESGRGWFIGGI
ncbi:MAG: hypothetical protein GIW94_14290 [Candidatus Eremiobacteraeota bacterium]|nr:hypothetical protein [Candidatus Eremiobacteraeota bacterium]MBC5823005.1 hypothetical protein [Candidatus Eremiobacteraeota bacterium]